jgi:hypothetical protein
LRRETHRKQASVRCPSTAPAVTPARTGSPTCTAQDLDAGEYRTHPSFDLVPTILHLLGQEVPARLSGRSMLEKLD